MAKHQARKLKRPWKDGYALDLHTISSVMIGHNEYGHPEFDTTYSEVGGLMHRLKYRSDKTTLPELVETAVFFIRSWVLTLVLSSQCLRPRFTELFSRC
jgi:hypothetical protein